MWSNLSRDKSTFGDPRRCPAKKKPNAVTQAINQRRKGPQALECIMTQDALLCMAPKMEMWVGQPFITKTKDAFATYLDEVDRNDKLLPALEFHHSKTHRLTSTNKTYLPKQFPDDDEADDESVLTNRFKWAREGWRRSRLVSCKGKERSADGKHLVIRQWVFNNQWDSRCECYSSTQMHTHLVPTKRGDTWKDPTR